MTVIPMLYIQLIGLVAVSISLVVFQTNSRDTMLKLGMTAAIFYTLHFILLGAFTGAAMNFIGGARCFVFYKFKPSKKHHGILFAFIGLAVAGTALTWQGPLSLLALAGSVGGAFAAWHTKPESIRRWAILVTPFWFIYDAISGSYAGMFIEVVILTSILIGEYRFDWRHKHHHRTRLARPV